MNKKKSFRGRGKWKEWSFFSCLYGTEGWDWKIHFRFVCTYTQSEKAASVFWANFLGVEIGSEKKFYCSLFFFFLNFSSCCSFIWGNVSRHIEFFLFFRFVLCFVPPCQHMTNYQTLTFTLHLYRLLVPLPSSFYLNFLWHV